MKTVYIPKGETVRYESLATEHLIVHGCLQVACGIKARTITGHGTINAGTVDADVIRVDDMESGSIVCKRLLAKRVQSPEVFASESAAVRLTSPPLIGMRSRWRMLPSPTFRNMPTATQTAGSKESFIERERLRPFSYAAVSSSEVTVCTITNT